ncbi:MAG: protein kinase [Myxococcales bacterium]|nr:MAG: protein kinase [Myxococcales bacterium]
MSPEQCAGAPVDSRTDIYAIGVIIYEMLCGSVPFDADNWMGILSKHLYEQPQRLSEQPLAENVPEALEALILKCMAKSPDHRYQSMGDLLSDLVQVQSGATRSKDLGLNLKQLRNAKKGKPSGKSSSFWQYYRPILAGAILALGLVAIGVGLGVMGSKQNEGSTPGSAKESSQPDTALSSAKDGSKEASSETVRLSSEPISAQVLESGLLLGVTPLEIPRPEAASDREIELRKPGYLPKRVIVNAESPRSLRIRLEREPRGGTRIKEKSKSPASPSNTGIPDKIRNPWEE